MIRKAEKNMANVFRLEGQKNLKCDAIRQQLLHVAGMETRPGVGLRFEGHNPGVPDCVIFDLSRASALTVSTGKRKPVEGPKE